MNDNVNAMYVATSGTFDNSGGIISYTDPAGTTNCLYTTPWGYWRDYYYPQVIRESYPVYVRERSEDKGKKAFEIIKMLQDKKFVKLDKVADFIDAMNALIEIV